MSIPDELPEDNSENKPEWKYKKKFIEFGYSQFLHLLLFIPYKNKGKILSLNKHGSSILSLAFLIVHISDLTWKFSKVRKSTDEYGQTYIQATSRFLSNSILRLSKDKQKNLLSILRESGYLESINFGKNGTRWIRINDDFLMVKMNKVYEEMCLDND